MSPTIDWPRLWAESVQWLEVGSEEFWRLTPREWAALRIAYELYEDRQDYRVNQLTAIYAENHRNREKNRVVYTVYDFMRRGDRYRPKANTNSDPVALKAQAIGIANVWNSALKQHKVRKAR